MMKSVDAPIPFARIPEHAARIMSSAPAKFVSRLECGAHFCVGRRGDPFGQSVECLCIALPESAADMESDLQETRVSRQPDQQLQGSIDGGL